MSMKIKTALEAHLLRRLDDPNVSPELLAVALEYLALEAEDASVVAEEDAVSPEVTHALFTSIGATHH